MSATLPDLEAPMPPSISESLIMMVGKLEAGLDALRDDIARLDQALRHNSDCWREIAKQQGATRASSEKLAERVTALAEKVEAVDAAVQPLVDWQRTGVKALAIITAAGGVIAVLFGPSLHRLSDALFSLIFPRM
jgi:methyl-accepting chemotaxis protein